MTTEFELVLFDLDGTLVDTGPDMAGALNRLLAEQGRPSLPYARVRPQVSNGALALVRLGFGDDLPAPRLEHLRQRFLAHYRRGLAEDSRPFAGMPELLDELEARACRWGVVTNKPGWLTEPLMAALGLLHRAACVVSGDTLDRRKPDPAPLLHACRLARCRPEHTLYVGDAERDMQAGRAAGMRSLVAGYGYIGADQDPQRWPADGLVRSIAELADWCRSTTCSSPR